MPVKILRRLLAVFLLLPAGLPARAQLRPQVTPPPKKAQKKPAPTAGPVRENLRDGLKYVWIPPGTFQMGCSPRDSECAIDEEPAHQVTISKGFWMGRTEVTVGAYKRFAAATGHQMPSAPDFNRGWVNDNMPIANVSWDDAQAFCQWAGGRLLTEAEWEYAARAGSTKARYGPLDDVAWYYQNSGEGTHEVAQKRANAWGLFDTLGNVWEWVNDWYDEHYYSSSPSTDPPGASTGKYRVLRGGSWNNNARNERVSNRVRVYPGSPCVDGGFRCVRDVRRSPGSPGDRGQSRGDFGLSGRATPHLRALIPTRHQNWRVKHRTTPRPCSSPAKRDDPRPGKAFRWAVCR